MGVNSQWRQQYKQPSHNTHLIRSTRNINRGLRLVDNSDEKSKQTATPLIPLRVVCGPEPIPADIGQVAGYTLDTPDDCLYESQTIRFVGQRWHNTNPGFGFVISRTNVFQRQFLKKRERGAGVLQLNVMSLMHRHHRSTLWWDHCPGFEIPHTSPRGGI